MRLSTTLAALLWVAAVCSQYQGPVEEEAQATPTRGRPATEMTFCDDKKNAAFSVGCSNAFVWCWDGVRSDHNCPANMAFDQDRGACDIEKNVFECSGKRPVPAPTQQQPRIVDFECPSDGLFGYKKTTECSEQFVQCSHGRAILRECGQGLAFDPEHSVCARPQHIAVCGGNPKELAPPEIEFDCPSPNGYFAHPSVLCDRVHFQCTDGEPTRKFCEDEEVFDEKTLKCRPQTEVAVCNFDCSERETGAYSLGCSQDYWWCWDHRATKHRCPRGLYFNADNGQCDRFKYVFECSGRRKAAPTTTAAAPTRPANFDCFAAEDGDYALSGYGECVAEFVQCANGAAFAMVCPSGLLFDPEQRRCDALANLLACGGIVPTQQAAEKPSFECPTPNGLFAHPTQLCSATYFQCENNQPKTQVCARGEVFEERLAQCEPASQVLGCDFDCSALENGEYSSGCSRYYWSCWDGRAQKLACPRARQRFDQRRGLCDVEPNVFECTGRHFIPTRVETPNQADIAEEFDCSAAGAGPDHALAPSECTASFVKCAGDIPYIFTCPGSLRFDPEELRCLSPVDVAACRRNDAPRRSGYESEKRRRLNTTTTTTTTTQATTTTTTEEPKTAAPVTTTPVGPTTNRRLFRFSYNPSQSQGDESRRLLGPTAAPVTTAAAAAARTYEDRRLFHFRPTTSAITTSQAAPIQDYQFRRFFRPIAPTTTTAAPTLNGFGRLNFGQQ